MGYVHPSGYWTIPLGDTRRNAFDAGKAYQVSHLEDADTIMSGYGYRRVAVEGNLLEGFEMNAFAPKGKADELWALGDFRDHLSRQTPNYSGSSGSNSVQIVGYVSPIGEYGHLGALKREVLVESITYLTK